jgi:hypothetical protein
MITLQRTCEACPEQYNALDEEGRIVAYLRLRHGTFTVQMGGPGGEYIYEAHPQGDGSFEFDEREFYLSTALEAIRNRLA